MFAPPPFPPTHTHTHTVNWVLALCFVVMWLYIASRIYDEERLMLQHFGQQYTSYKRTIGGHSVCVCDLRVIYLFEILMYM